MAGGDQKHEHEPRKDEHKLTGLINRVQFPVSKPMANSQLEVASDLNLIWVLTLVSRVDGVLLMRRLSVS